MIRWATPEDAIDIYRLLLRMHAENGIARLDDEKAFKHLEHVLSEGWVAVAERDGRIVGSIGLKAVQLWYSDEWQINETWFYVAPEARKSSAASRLLKEANRLAEHVGLPLVVTVITENELEKKCRFVARYARPIGQIFMGGNRVLRR